MDCVECMSTGLSTCCELSIIVVTNGCTDKRGGADVVEVIAGVAPVARSAASGELEDMVLVREDAKSRTGVGSA